MVSTTWKQSIDSNVSALYVQPLYPKQGEMVSVSIQVDSSNTIKQVRLVSFQLGREMQIVLDKVQEGSRTLYKGSFKLVDTSAYWYFFLVTDERAYSYSKVGVKASVPPLAECFHLVSDLVPVTWVGSGLCYQVFPDRFRKGDLSVGAREGQYRFDGGEVTIHGFDEIPLEFEEGRCLDFFNGDLKGIEDAIDHFKSLGVTVLYLNPIGMSRTTHRYDCTDFFHVDEKLGGDEAFAHLCEALHKEGIRVVVDISINHTGTEHPWYKKALSDPSSKEATYYYINEDGSVAFWQDVETLPQLNYNSEELRDLIYRSPDSVLRSFLRKPYLQDGWRLDVASEVGRRGDDQLCEEIWREVRQAVKKENNQAYLVGEDWVDSTPFLQGDMWDATMNYLGSSRPMRSWMGEKDRYMADGWGQNPGTTRAFNGIEFAQALQSHLQSMPQQMLSMQMNLINSHDTPRLYAHQEIFDFSLYAGIVKLLYVLPGMPNIYYGEEIALPGPYGSVESARYPMQWDQEQWNKDFFSLYSRLGQFRSAHADTLAHGAWKLLYSDEYSLCFVRYTNHEAIFCILGKHEMPTTITLDNTLLQITCFNGCDAERAIVHTHMIEVSLKERDSLLLVGKR
ncbi:glycoside hydrolase family 13 protein [uncultured Sphaerochaeta sp.]|uniref:glycoside hydrolase family 13 protein n=1 Tax=uncultured Sphaerochaeta sp. TaxID=886478 RepID=UPI002A0A27B9|nr:glycoside hydrolase family 13 protein [uncultured Sphaerochaeta sp.]